MVDVYDQCEAILGEDSSAKDLLRCVVNTITNETSRGEDATAFAVEGLLLHSAVLVFLMQAGFAMLVAGSVRSKNVANTLLKNLLDACGASFAFFAVGYAFAFGGDDSSSPNKTFIGTTGFFLVNISDDELARWIFEYAFAASSTTIVAGALAERCQMAAYLCYSILLVGWVYPIIAHAVWSTQGFLSGVAVDPLWGVGMLDFAGCGVVHLTGGVVALLAAKVLGPRKGRFHDEKGQSLNKPRDIPGHSISMQMLGCFLLWVGWFGFNSGSAFLLNSPYRSNLASLAGVNTALSAGMGGLSSLFLNLFIMDRLTGEGCYDLRFAINGTLSGAVAITGACGLVEPWVAVIIGFIAGLLYIAGHHLVLWMRIDDCVDAIAVHLVNGVWGLIALGLFATPRRLQEAYGRSEHVGFFYSFAYEGVDGKLLLLQMVGIIFIIGWVTAIMLPFFIWLDWKGWLRSDPLEELVGLDISYHGGCVLGSEVHPEYIMSSSPEHDMHHQGKLTPSLSSNADTILE